MFFNEYLKNLNSFQSFQLYTIIAVLIFLPYYFFTINIDKSTSDSDKTIVQIKQNIQDLKEKLKIPNTVKVLKDFESEAKKYTSLQIENTTINKNSITISGDSLMQDFLHYLVSIENYSSNSNLESVMFKPLDKNRYSFSFNVTFKKTFFSKLSKVQIIELKEKITSLSNTKNTNRLQAIIDDFAIIDGEFLKKGDKYNKQVILEIKRDHIVLSGKKKLYIDEGFNNGKIE